jgi:hypothetical protein
MNKSFFIGAIFCLCSTVTFSQSSKEFWAPSITYSWSQTEKLSFKLISEAFISTENLGNENVLERADIALLGTYKLSSKTKISGKYMYRESKPLDDNQAYEHRITEQLEIKGALFGNSVDHRFRVEQRIKASSFTNRLRYRLAKKFPVGEGKGNYIKAYDELLFSFNEETYFGENRIFGGYGFLLTGKTDMELGIQYRTQNFFKDSGISHLFLFTTVLNLK